MKKHLLWPLFLFVSAVAIAAETHTWADDYDSPNAVELVMDPACKTKCTATVTLQAPSKNKNGQPLTWRELVQISPGANLLDKACVMDDGPRPTGFAQKRERCK